jgi:hypothetical protein
MANSVPLEGKALHRPWAAVRSVLLDRRGGFRVIYVAFLAFVLLYIFSVKALERGLSTHFERAVAEAVTVDPMAGRVTARIQENVDRVVRGSYWVRPGGVRVNVLVFGADGQTPLYVGGRPLPLPHATDAMAALREAARLLPARAEVSVSVPHNALAANAILVVYATVLLTALFVYNRALGRREDEELARATAARDSTAERAAHIERELDAVRQRLADVEPAEESHVLEIQQLEAERASLQRQLAALAERETVLRNEAQKSSELDAERKTLEEMLDEALRDVGKRDDEIRALEARLKRAAKDAPAAPRLRESEQLGRRLRALYKNLEIDDRAIDDLVGLRDADMQLKAEEALKRLSDEPDTAAIRRKVGGLPPHLSIFELGFAGKGRIYYTRGAVRRYRILAVGAKNSQKTDLEYLSRLG